MPFNVVGSNNRPLLMCVSLLQVHILPRRFGDFEPNDIVYDAIDEASKGLHRQALLHHIFHAIKYFNVWIDHILLQIQY